MKQTTSLYRNLLAAFLLLATSQTLCAQDAFYIYRNDGDFDGFFYDQVERMGYSKTDLEGVEHDTYVVQEIQTTDSLYRIPLAAIDSIGFQQPEIRFNPRLKDMDATGITPYVSHVDAYQLSLRFDKSIPASLIPTEGDVLAGFDKEKYGESGFVGKVRNVTKYSTGVVDCDLDSISDWGDIFDQFITVEQIGIDDAGNIRRRVAGYDEFGNLQSDSQRKVSGNVSVNIINWGGRLQYEWKPGIGSNESFNIGIDVGVKVKAQASFAITGVFTQRFFMKLVFSEELSAGASIHAQISGGDTQPIDTPLGMLGGIKFPAVFPLFEVNPIPKGFFRYGGSIDASLQLPSFSFGASQTIIIDTDDPKKMSFKWGNRDGEGSYDKVESDYSWIDAGVVFNGFIQAGVMTQLGLNTNSWLSKLLHAGVGLEVYFGPKLEAELNLSASGALASGSYGALKDSRVALTPACMDRELKYKWRVGKQKDERTMWSDSKKWGEYSLYLLPEFLKTKVKFNETDRTLSATIYPRREVLIGSTIGIGVYSKDNPAVPVAEIQNPSDYSYTNQYNEFSTKFEKLEAGVYNVGPYVKMFGTKLPVNDDNVYTEVTVPPVINIPQDSVIVDEHTQVIKIPFKTNCKDVAATVLNYGAGSSIYNTTLSTHESMEKSDTLVVELTENQSLFKRDDKIVLTATIGDIAVSDTVKVKQRGGSIVSNEAYIDVARYSKGTYHYTSVSPDREDLNSDKTEPLTNAVGFSMNSYSYGQGVYKNVDTKVSKNDDLLSVDMDVVTYDETTNNSYHEFEKFDDEGSSRKLQTSHISLVIDLSEEPARVISGSFSENYQYSAEWDDTSWGGNLGETRYVWIVSKGNSTEQWSTEGSFTCDLKTSYLTAYKGDEKYKVVRFDGINLSNNWLTGNYQLKEKYESNTVHYRRDGTISEQSRLTTNKEGSSIANPDDVGRFGLSIYYK